MSIGHWVVVALIVLLLFGRGKISDIMGDFAKGIRSFKKGLNEDDEAAATKHTLENNPSVSARDTVGQKDKPHV